METETRDGAALRVGGDQNLTQDTNDRNSGTKNPRVKPGTKESVILTLLLFRTLNRFEAIKFHDTALNSTISAHPVQNALATRASLAELKTHNQT